MKRVIFNPEMRPDFHYRNLKSLFLIYDEIIIWQPSDIRLEEMGMDVNEFLSLLDPLDINGKTTFPIRPAGRELFFEESCRRNDPDWFRNEFSLTFLKDISERKIISPYKNRIIVEDSANKLLNTGNNSDIWRARAKGIFSHMKIDKKPDVIARMERNAQNRNISIIEANFQEFLMDMYVKKDISEIYGIKIDKLLVDKDHWRSYSLIDETSVEDFEDDKYIRSALNIKEIDQSILDPSVKEFFEIFFNASSIPLSELVSYKIMHQDLISHYIFGHKESILTGSLVKDSLELRQGIYKYIQETYLNSLKFLSNSAGVASKLAGGGSDELQSIISFSEYLEKCGFFANVMRRLDFIPRVDRKFLINSKINISNLFQKIPIDAEDPVKKYYPMFLDTVGFEKEFSTIS